MEEKQVEDKQVEAVEQATTQVQCDKVIYVTLDDESIKSLIDGTATTGVVDLHLKIGVQVSKSAQKAADDSTPADTN